MEEGEFFTLTSPFHQGFKDKMKTQIPTEYRRWNDEDMVWEISWEYNAVLEQIAADTIAFEGKKLNFEWEDDHLTIKFT